MQEKKMARGFDLEDENEPCEGCLTGKQHRHLCRESESFHCESLIVFYHKPGKELPEESKSKVAKIGRLQGGNEERKTLRAKKDGT